GQRRRLCSWLLAGQQERPHARFPFAQCRVHPARLPLKRPVLRLKASTPRETSSGPTLIRTVPRTASFSIATTLLPSISPERSIPRLGASTAGRSRADTLT